MHSRHEPLVSIVTPVFNGQKFLAECIESVLDQTYKNFEYHIVDNCSTDRTGEIAHYYSARDERIKVHHNPSYLAIIPNWNAAMRRISNESRYCKVVHCDDFLMPACLDQMVALAEDNPSVGIIGSYRLDGRQVTCNGLPYSRSVMPGKEVARATFRREYFLFGSPSSLLMRSEVVRERDPFYDEAYYHADTAACFEILKTMDFGFVHQVLTSTRRHDESQSSCFGARYGTLVLERLLMLREFGPTFLDPLELSRLEARAEWEYYRFLARRVFNRTTRDCFDYHRRRLRERGSPLDMNKLFAASLVEVVNNMLNPLAFSQRIKKNRPVSEVR